MNQKEKLQDPFATLPPSLLKKSTAPSSTEVGKIQQTRKEPPPDPFSSIPKKAPPPDPFATLLTKPKGVTGAATNTNTVGTIIGGGGGGKSVVLLCAILLIKRKRKSPPNKSRE